MFKKQNVSCLPLKLALLWMWILSPHICINKYTVEHLAFWSTSTPFCSQQNMHKLKHKMYETKCIITRLHLHLTLTRVFSYPVVVSRYRSHLPAMPELCALPMICRSLTVGAYGFCMLGDFRKTVIKSVCTLTETLVPVHFVVPVRTGTAYLLLSLDGVWW